MSTENATTCPACGARLAADADVCDLCGTPVEATDLPQVEDATELPDDARGDEAAASADAPASEGVFCNACGWNNPTGARYCSQCGEALQDMGDARPKPVEADLPRRTDEVTDGADPEPANGDAADASDDVTQTSSLVSRQVGLTVGVAILAIVGLFAATTWSQQIDWGASESMSDAPPASSSGAAASSMDLETLVQENAADSIPDPLRNRIATLEDEIAQRSGEEQRTKQQELANLYVGAGQLGRAALVQRHIAEANGQADAWRRTGDLLYSWMETLEGKQPASSIVAEHVVDAYQKVLEQQPGNLDVRTDMATAYLQTNQPMRGVQEINRVLEADPNHFQARFNKGIMLTMIGRAEEAIQQFEQVKEIVGSDSPYYQQANQAIETIKQRMNDSGSS